ncbi:hypothetical protein, partial [Streptococcus thermophilus]
FIIGHMGLFFYNQKGSIISIEDLPTTEIIEPNYLEALQASSCFFYYLWGYSFLLYQAAISHQRFLTR